MNGGAMVDDSLEADHDPLIRRSFEYTHANPPSLNTSEDLGRGLDEQEKPLQGG